MSISRRQLNVAVRGKRTYTVSGNDTSNVLAKIPQLNMSIERGDGGRVGQASPVPYACLGPELYERN